MISLSLYLILRCFLKSAQIPWLSPNMPSTPTLPRKSPHAALPCVTSLVYPAPCLVILQVFAFPLPVLSYVVVYLWKDESHLPCTHTLSCVFSVPHVHPLVSIIHHSPDWQCFAVPGSSYQSSLHLIPGFRYIPWWLAVPIFHIISTVYAEVPPPSPPLSLSYTFPMPTVSLHHISVR